MKNRNSILIIIFIIWISGLSTKLVAQSLPADTTYAGLFNALKSEPDPTKKEFLLNIMKTKPQVKNTQLLLDASSQYTAIAYAEVGNADKAMFWANQIVQPSWRNGMKSTIVHYLSDLGKLSDVEKIITPVIHPSNPADTLGNSISVQEKERLCCQYGILKYKQGKYKEAIPYLAPSAERQVSEGAEMYVLALIKTGDQVKALTEADLLLSKGEKVGDDLKRSVKPLFIKKYGNADYYQSLLDSINIKYDDQIAERVASGRISEPAPNFEITDTNGKTVSLKSLKGKTVIIDFWATWCIPCISSFPGMQKAVNYYKNDKSVVFLFVHTWEKGNTTFVDARKIIDSKNYDFNVYMDLKDKVSGKNPLSEAFKLKALPTKVVIDKSGVIRFKNTGGMSELDALPEIMAMINQCDK